MEEAYETIDAAVMERVDAGENIGDVITREMAREWEIFSQLARPPFAGEETGEETGGGSRGRVQSGEDILGEEIRQELDETLLGTIRRYGESNNITIVLIDSSTGKAVLNSGREGEFLARKAQRYVLGMGHEQTEILVQCDNYVVEKNQDHRQGGNYLESWGFFSDNNTLFLTACSCCVPGCRSRPGHPPHTGHQNPDLTCALIRRPASSPDSPPAR